MSIENCNPKITIETLKKRVDDWLKEKPNNDGGIWIVYDELIEQIANKYAPEEVKKLDNIIKPFYGPNDRTHD